MRKFFSTEVPLWAVIGIILALGGGMLAIFSYARKSTGYFLEAPTSVSLGKIGELRYGEEPKLSDPDFFGRVKDELIEQKASFVEADLSAMQIRVYKDGVVAKESPIRTKGREGSWWETPAGMYRIESREKNHFSSFGKVYQPWSMAFQGNFFIHGWPYYPDGKPVSSSYSGGCIRLADEDAKEIFDMVTVGMPVLVFEKDFEPDSFAYTRRSAEISAPHFFVADLKNNFVFLEKGSGESIPLGAAGPFLGGLAAAEYINIERQITLNENMISTTTGWLSAGEEVTPFDLLHLMLLEASNEPIAVFEGLLGEKRYASLVNGKAKAVGMRTTEWSGFSKESGKIEGKTSASDLFYLAKYLYNNRNFLLKISAGTANSSAYGVSQFHSLENRNIFSSDKRFMGGKYVSGEEGSGDFLGIFEIMVRGEKRPIFVFFENSADLKGDVEKTFAYIQASYE